MSSLIIDNMTTSWQPDASGLWSLNVSADAANLGSDGLGMSIVASSGSASPAPFARRHFTPSLNLQGWQELRVWFRSSRVGDGSASKPFYLAFQVTEDPPNPATTWTRLVPVQRANSWELHRFWLGDMSAGLIQAIGFLQLGSLDPTVAFNAALDDVMAVTPEPLSDVDAGFLARLNNQFQVTVNGVLTNVPAIVDLPENPSATNPPYIQITPWSVKPLVDVGGSEPIVDNYTTTGACVRPRPAQVQAEYRIDAYAQNRAQKTQLLDAMLTTFSSQPYLVVDDERLPLVPIEIPAVETANFTPPGRTPLFYQLDCWLETGQRQMYPQAVPYLVLGPLNGKDTVEKVKV